MKKFVLTLTALSVSAAVNAAILDVHGDIQIDGKTVITAQGEVIDASRIDLTKYLVWPAGTYTFTEQKEGGDTYIGEYNQAGKEVSFTELENGVVTGEGQVDYTADDPFSETNTDTYTYTNIQNHWYQVQVIATYICTDSNGQEEYCMKDVLIVDENEEPVLDENGSPTYEQVPDTYERTENRYVDVTEVGNCTATEDRSILSAQSYSSAVLGMKTSILNRETVVGSYSCDISYQFPEMTDKEAKVGFEPRTDQNENTYEQLEVSSVVPIALTPYTLDGEVIEDCLIVHETEGYDVNDTYNKYGSYSWDSENEDESVRVYCTGIGLVEHQDIDDLSDPETKMIRTDFEAAK